MGKVSRDVELAAALGSQTVIDSVCEKTERREAAQAGEHVEQRHRIGSAAHGDENGCASRK
jgi:hypothetical protein